MSKHHKKLKPKDTSSTKSKSKGPKAGDKKSGSQSPEPKLEQWSAWEWSTEGSFYWRARKDDKDKWEYETSTPSSSPSSSLEYQVTPEAEYPKGKEELFYVKSEDPVYEEEGYTWEMAEKMGGSGKKEDTEGPDAKVGIMKETEKENTKEEKGDTESKDAGKGGKSSVGGSDEMGDGDADNEVEVDVKAKAKEKKRAKYNHGNPEEKPYERKQWRRREKRK